MAEEKNKVEGWLDEYGEQLVVKIMNSDDRGADAARANLFRTIVEHSIAKPAPRGQLGTFEGSVVINVKPVE